VRTFGVLSALPTQIRSSPVVCELLGWFLTNTNCLDWRDLFGYSEKGVDSRLVAAVGLPSDHFAAGRTRTREVNNPTN
jgi:hypothetical protein